MNCPFCGRCSDEPDRATLVTVDGVGQRIVEVIDVRIDNGNWIPIVIVESKGAAMPSKLLTESTAQRP